MERNFRKLITHRFAHPWGYSAALHFIHSIKCFNRGVSTVLSQSGGEVSFCALCYQCTSPYLRYTILNLLKYITGKKKRPWSWLARFTRPVKMVPEVGRANVGLRWGVGSEMETSSLGSGGLCLQLRLEHCLICTSTPRAQIDMPSALPHYNFT